MFFELINYILYNKVSNLQSYYYLIIIYLYIHFNK